jgi:hypothetical protein
MQFFLIKTTQDKFQAIAVEKKTYAKEPVFNIESANICDEVVKLLGIDIDYQLNENHFQFLYANKFISWVL